MFERFTDRARRVIVVAQEEARRLNHNYIGTEHLVLGLLHDGDGVACKALESLGVSLEAVRQRVHEIIGMGQTPPTGHIPFTPRLKKVLEFALREATQLGHNYIGTEHLLLGVIREGEGVGAQVLVQVGADLNKARQRVIGLLSGHTTGTSPPYEPISVSARAEMTLDVAPMTEAMPLCPSCRHSLEGSLASKSLEIEARTERLFVVFCATCGVAIETRFEEPRE